MILLSFNMNQFQDFYLLVQGNQGNFAKLESILVTIQVKIYFQCLFEVVYTEANYAISYVRLVIYFLVRSCRYTRGVETESLSSDL